MWSVLPDHSTKGPLILCRTQLIGSPSSICFAAAHHVHNSSGAITYDYSFAWQRVKRALKMSLPEQLTDLLTDLRPTSDFLALIWTMTLSVAVLSSVASELEGCCGDIEAVCALSEDEVTASSDVLYFIDDRSLSASSSVFRLSETV